jgi:hypothetical protein
VPLTASERILEDLLETQELKNGEVDSRVETKTALVRTESGVELHTVALVDLALALVVFPDNTELDDTLGDGDNFESLLVLGVLLEKGGGLEGGDELCELKLANLRSIESRGRQMLLHRRGMLSYWDETYPCGLAQTLAQTL